MLPEVPSHTIDFSQEERKQLQSILHCLEHPGAPYDDTQDCIDSRSVNVQELVREAASIVQKKEYPESELNWYYVKLRLMQQGGRRKAAQILREILGLKPASRTHVSELISSVRRWLPF